MLNSMMEHYYCIEIQHNLTKNEYTHGKYQRQCGPIFKSLLNLLQYCLFYVCFFFFFFAMRHILAARPGIELVPLALEGEILTTEPPGKSLIFTSSLSLLS